MKTLVVGAKNKVEDVHRAQRLLSGNNVFSKRTYFNSGKARTDLFGHDESVAAKNMKWWLGYELKKCTPTYGDELDGYLSGKKKLTKPMHARRIKRKFERKPPPPQTEIYISPIKIPNKSTFLGGPGAGTHSWLEQPNNWQSDNARDYGCAKGTPLVAVADGVIGSRIGPISSDGGRFAGQRLYLMDKWGREWYYAHLSSISVKAGQHVKQGQTLGLSGVASGVAHLHLGCSKGDPMTLLPRNH